ncbi:MAG: CBS domain-containing protein [Calditrichia bacterium]
MKLSELLHEKEVFVIRPDQNTQEAAELMAEKGIGALPVVKDDNLVGIFTERDMLKRVIAGKRVPAETNVESVMTKELIVVEPDHDVNDCIALMKKFNIRHIPVVKDNDLTGIISLRDLLQIEIEDKSFEIRVLNEYIHYIPPYKVKEQYDTNA